MIRVEICCQAEKLFFRVSSLLKFERLFTRAYFQKHSPAVSCVKQVQSFSSLCGQHIHAPISDACKKDKELYHAVEMVFKRKKGIVVELLYYHWSHHFVVFVVDDVAVPDVSWASCGVKCKRQSVLRCKSDSDGCYLTRIHL